MATRPTGNLPTWATDDLYTSGPAAGESTKVEPLTGEKAQGYQKNRKPPASKFNWLLNKVAGWVSYMADHNWLNWGWVVTKEPTGTAIDVSIERPDGSAQLFYRSGTDCWIATGCATSESFYFGDHGQFTLQGTGIAGTRKYTFGVDCILTGRVLLFTHTATGAGVSVKCARSDPNSLVTWTETTVTAAPATVAQMLDAVVIPGGTGQGRVVVCGALDTNYKVWYSDDSGATWTAVTVAALPGGGSPLNKIIYGKNGRLVTWAQNSAGNGGNVLWYSDDQGATWTSRTAIGFANIRDGVYLAGDDCYAFLVPGFGVYFVDDLVSGAFTLQAFTGTLLAMAGMDSAIVLSATIGVNSLLVLLTNKGTVSRFIHAGAPVKFVGTMPFWNQVVTLAHVASQGYLQFSEKA